MSTRKYHLVRILLWVVYPLGLFLTITLMFLTCNNKSLKTKQDVPATEGIPVRKEFHCVPKSRLPGRTLLGSF